MAKVEASRFAILTIDDDYDSDEKRSGSGTKAGGTKGGVAGGKQGGKQGVAGSTSQAAKKKSQAKKKDNQEVRVCLILSPSFRYLCKVP